MKVSVSVKADRVTVSSRVEVDSVTTVMTSLDTYDVGYSVEADTVSTEITVEMSVGRVEVQASAAVGRCELAFAAFMKWVGGSELAQILTYRL